MPALEVDGLSVDYGGVRAVDGAALAVEAGTITGLIGPNGAGKTSVIDALTGFTPASGRVVVGGRDLTRDPPHRRVAAGLVRTWQNADLFGNLSVRDNVQVTTDRGGLWATVAGTFAGGRRGCPPAVDDALALLGLEDVADRRPDELSHGRRKLVGVARALASGASVLLLDEPAAGLDDNESDVLRERVRGVADSGVAVVLVEHDMRLVFSLCDEIVVMVQGRIIFSGLPADGRRDPAVVAAYLGSPTGEGR